MPPLDEKAEGVPRITTTTESVLSTKEQLLMSELVLVDPPRVERPVPIDSTVTMSETQSQESVTPVKVLLETSRREPTTRVQEV